ncbi:MAG: dihydroorotase family protein, partial [Candidatus Bathyarchaeia archaeon]
SIAINKGKILAIGHDSHLPKAKTTFKANGRLVMPGVIDGHTHLWEPGWTYREDFRTGTRGAAKGGITTVLEHPLSNPPTIDAKTFRGKRKLAEKKAVVDFGLDGGVIPGSALNVRGMWQERAVAVKMFMCYSVKEFPYVMDGDMYVALQQIAKVNGLALIHAENDFILSYNEKRLKAAGRKDYLSHIEWRPDIAEIEASQRAVFFLEQTGARGIIVHESLPEVVDIVNQGKKRGVKVYSESCPHYFYLTTDDLKKKGPWMKCAPPIRDKSKVARMREMLAAGYIDLVGSDHAPFMKEEKEKGEDDMWICPNGLPGNETMLPLMLTGVNDGWVPIERVVQVFCENPARAYGIYPRKGAIQPGADADLVVVDMKKQVVVKGEEIEAKCHWSPFDRRKIKGVPVMTMVRGKPVYQDEEIVAKPGYGKFMPRLS